MILLRFSVSGYRGFRDPIDIDFTDKKNYQFGKECVRGEVLDKIVIVGGNGVGKTNFGYALVDIITTVTGFTRDIGQMDERCFLNGYSHAGKAEFCYDFIHKGCRIEYSYCKDSPTSILSERLAVDRQVLFDYSASDPASGTFDLARLGLSEENVAGLDGTVSLVRMCSEKHGSHNDPSVDAVWRFARQALYYRAMWKKDEHIGLMDTDDDVEGYIIGNGYLGEFLEFLKDVGLECKGICSSGRELVIRTDEKEIPFSDAASRGTMIMCRLFCWIKRCRDSDALIFFDDFDDMYHFTTARAAITKIISSNRSQCVFVTHNSGLITNDFLRPDCCFILESGKLSSLASRTEKDIRKGHNLEKMLRDGVFDRSSE